jgi:hypothetical protein
MLSLSVMLRATNPAAEHMAPGLGDLLAKAGGYHVDGPSGRVGTVRAVRFEAATGTPDYLRVRTGLLVRRTVPLGIDEVTSVAPIRRRVAVTTDAAR